MKRHVENENQAETVEISMGTLFTVRSFGKVTKRVDVITDIAESNYFYSAQLQKDSDGVYFGIGGTGGPEVFGRVVGQMSPEEVIEAAKLGARKLGYEYTQGQIDYLLTSAQKGTRSLSLNR